MQGQGRDVVQGTAGQVVGVHLAGFQPAAPRRVKGSQRLRHLDDGVATARQLADQLADLAIGPHRDPGRHHHQFVRRLGVKLRVGAQEMQELVERAGEARVGHRLAHLGLDAGDLRQADLVDLLTAQIQRRIFADLRFIKGDAVRHVAGRQRGTGARLVFLQIEVQQRPIGRDHRLIDDSRGLGAQARLVGRRNGRRHLAEGRVEGVGLGRVGDEVGDGGLTAFQRHARHAETARQAVAHIGLLLVEIARDVAHSRDKGAVVLGCAQAAGLVQIGPEGAVAVERHLPLASLTVDQGMLQIGAEDGGVDAVLVRQLIQRNAVQLLQHLAHIGQALLLGGRADVGQTVRRAVFAIGAFDPAGAGHAGLGFRLIERLQPRPGLLHLRGGRGSLDGERRRDRRDQKRRNGAGRQQQGSHDTVPILTSTGVGRSLGQRQCHSPPPIGAPGGTG
ncbi:hypothetical protein ACMZ4W_00907 [Brevundimonas naejangsanensis]